MANEVVSSIGSAEDFKNTPSGWHRRWQSEIKSAQKTMEDYHKKADKTVEQYEADKYGGDRGQMDARVNLFWSNVGTLEAILYSNLPTVDVSRKFADANDDVARVAALLMQRILDYDVADNGREYNTVLKQVVQDRLIPGLGAARLYYDYDSEEIEYEAMHNEDGTELAPAYTEESITNEKVTCEYQYWGDVLWGWSRTWADIPWLAFRNYLTKDEVEERFGEKYVKQLKFQQNTVNVVDGQGEQETKKEIWQKAEVWEIWDKDTATVYWYGDGASTILDKKKDPLELRNFFPAPAFWMANLTTRFCMPKPDFAMSQDLYNEIDILHSRISVLTEAVRVVGVYDKSSEGIQRMFTEGTENELIPVDNWAMFAEKGGIQGQIDWVPIEQVVNAIMQLRQLREDNIYLLEKITGMSDIIQGQGTHPREGVGTQQMKAEYGSIKIQTLQEELAQFATDVLELKAEIISKHCTTETLLAMANAEFIERADHQYIEPAIELLKNWDQAALRVKVRSESMAMVDYSRIRSERTEFISNMAMFMQSAAPLVALDQAVTPFLLEMLKWGMAGFKGSMEIEGTLDEAIKSVQEAPQKKGDDEQAQKAQQEQARMQAEITKIHEKTKADLQIIQAKLMAKMQEIEAKAMADSQKEEAQAMFNAMEKEVDTMFQTMINEAQSSLRIEEIKEQKKGLNSDG